MNVNQNYSGIIIENIDGKLLFQLRDDKPSIPNSNMWSLFGGGIEKGESPIQAIIREVNEELGFYLDEEKIKILVKKESKNGNRYLYYYKFHEPSQNFKLGEGQKYEFMRLNEILLRKNVVTSLRLFMLAYPLIKLIKIRK